MRSDSLSAVRGRSTLPASAIDGRPSAPTIDSAGRHVRLSSASARLATIGLVAAGERILADHDLAHDVGGGARLRRALLGNRAREIRRAARGRSPNPRAGRASLPRDAERRRHDAARVARVHAFGQHFDGQRAGRRCRAATSSPTAARSRRSRNRGRRRNRRAPGAAPEWSRYAGRS